MKLHLPGHGAPRPPVDPARPHRFVQVDDPGMGAAASGAGGNRGTSSLRAAMVTDTYLRQTRCGVPGCGRERHDEIHAAPED